MTPAPTARAGLRASSDWCEAFEYATKPQPCLGYDGSTAGASIDDVAEVVARSDGENDGADWVGVFVLADGRYLFLAAGCDYTGWDCQAAGSAWVAADLEGLVQYGLTSEARERLRLNDPERVAVVAALVGVASPAEALEVLRARGLWPWELNGDEAARWWCSMRSEQVERLDDDGQAYLDVVECHLCGGAGWAHAPSDIAHVVALASLGCRDLTWAVALIGEFTRAPIVWRVMSREALRAHHERCGRVRHEMGDLGVHVLATVFSSEETNDNPWPVDCPWDRSPGVQRMWAPVRTLAVGDGTPARTGFHIVESSDERIVIAVEAL